MLYDYVCKECGEEFEVSKKMSDPHPSSCPLCGGKNPERLFRQAPALFYRDRPPWTYKEALKYKTARWNGGPRTKIDPSKHGDLGSWNSPGEIVPLTARDRELDTKQKLKKG